jgi:hypothetical protein
MQSFADIIDQFRCPDRPHDRVLAELLGVEESHVRAMRTRDSIGVNHWSRLIKAARKHGIRGITFERLVALRDERIDWRRAS